MTIMSPVVGEGRRFRYVTDDEDKEETPGRAYMPEEAVQARFGAYSEDD